VMDQLAAFVDARFDQLQAEVNKVRSRVLKHQVGLPSRQLANEWPEPVAVTFENFKAAREARSDVQPPDDVVQAIPSTSGTKRKRSSARPATKRSKTSSSGTTRTKKFACKFQGCDQLFRWDSHLKYHERIHLSISPFRCTWPGCNYAVKQKPHAVRHVRTQHFKLPLTLKLQQALGITDDRDPNDFIVEDQELAARRLE